MASTERTTQSFQFHGRVLPMGYKMNMHRKVDNLVVTPKNKIPIDFKISIEDSIILIECQCYAPLSEDIFNESFIIANKITHNVVDLMCFHYGLVLTVILEEWTDPDLNRIPIKTQNRALLGIGTSVDPGRLDIPLKLLFDEPDVALILHDLTRAMRFRDDIAINCARVIDGIKHQISLDNKDENTAWARMRDVLNIDEKYVRFISENSRNPRHRKPNSLTGRIISEILDRSWKIMNRYLEYRFRNSGPLREPEFPLLTG